MSRGRKAKSNSFNSEWEQLFDINRGYYFQYVITRLGTKDKVLSDENSKELLEEIEREREKLIADNKIKNGRLPFKVKFESVPFEIPSNWAWCRLNDLGFFTGGGTPSMSNSEYWDGDISWISPKDMGLDFVNESEMKITKSGVDNSAAKLIPPNSILIVGRSGILKRKLPVAINKTECTVNQDMKVIIPYLSEMSPFLQYMLFGLQDIILKDYVKFGMTVHSLKYKEFEAMPVPLPPRSEQKQILDFFQDFSKNGLDKNREYFNSEIESEVLSLHQAQLYNNQITTELSHQLELVSGLRQAFLREAMQGKLVPQDASDEPAAVLLEKIKAEKEKLIAEKKIKKQKPLPEIKPEEIPFEIPNNWTRCRLGDLCFVTKLAGFEYTKYFKPKKQGEIPIVRAQNIKPNNFLANNLLYIEEEISLQLERSALTKPCLLITFIGSVGEVAIFDRNERWHLAPNVAKAELLYDELELKYLMWFLLSDFGKQEFFKVKKETVQASLSMQTIRGVTIPLPPLVEQKRIVEKLEKLMKFCDELETNIRESATRAETLLQVALKEALEPR